MPKIYSEELKRQAIELRKLGFSYSEIQKHINYPIPKNTFTNWFKSIVLSEEAKERITNRIRLGGAPGRAVAWQNTHNKRLSLLEDLYNQASNEITNIDTVSAKLCLAMLYLGEGGKTNEFVRFGNSDPRIIKLFLTLFRQVYSINENKFRGRVQCRADQHIPELERYWSDISSIPLTQFNKTLVDKRTLGIPTRKLNYKGVFVIEYYSNKLFLELKFISDIIYQRFCV